MPILLDAFNCLHVTGVLPPELAGLDLDGLADLVARSRFARDEAWVVCDGAKPARPPDRRAGIVFTWAGPGGSADEVIVGLVERSSAPRGLTVVTSDRALARRVRRRKVDVVRSEEFLRLLAGDAGTRSSRRATAHGPRPTKPAVPLADQEVWRWLRHFGLDPADRSLPASTAPKGQRAEPVAAAPQPEPCRIIRSFADLEGIDLGSFDMAALLRDPPPRRDGERARRLSRKDRRG